MHAVCHVRTLGQPSQLVVDLIETLYERRPTSRREVSHLLGALILYRYAVVLLAEFERSVVTNLERLHVVFSDVE